MLRFDAAIARLWAAAHSKDGNPKPLMPWPKEEEVPASAEDVLKFLNARVKKKD